LRRGEDAVDATVERVRMWGTENPIGDHDWSTLSNPPAPSEFDPADYARQTESNLVFDDPEGYAEKLEILRAAGVRNVVTWMGVGGVAPEHVLRSMRLFAEEVRPAFA
jgi:hypothetical protein